MSLTRTACRSRTRSLIAEPVARFFTDVEINEFIDDGVRDISLKTMCSQVLCTAIATVVNCAEYTYPTTYNATAIETIAIKTIISSANIALQYITPDLIGRVGDASEMKWSDWGRQFIITPVPTAIYTLKPLVLVEQGCTAAGTLGIPGCYHHLVPLYATYKAYQKRRSFELAGAVAQQYDEELGGILATITTKFMVNSIKQSIANQSAAD